MIGKRIAITRKIGFQIFERVTRMIPNRIIVPRIAGFRVINEMINTPSDQTNFGIGAIL